jgi:CDP-glucose 4,6-dehydratase
VIVASSDKAYGKDCIDATEDAPMAGDHPYDVSKSCADLIARMYATTYQMPVAVSRFGNIYGPGDLNLNRIVPGIMQAVYTGSVLPLRSDGTFVRDYVYVKDVVAGYLTLMKHMDTARGEAYNFSTGYNYSVREMIELIGKILGTTVQYTVVNDQKNEIPKQSLNYTKAEKVLGWSSAFTFEEGIRETAEWYKRYFQV